MKSRYDLGKLRRRSQTKENKPRVLHLTLKRKWFDLIGTGQKSVEYRAAKSYWQNRLFLDLKTDAGELIPRRFDEIHFRNGYGTTRPLIVAEWQDTRLLGGADVPGEVAAEIGAGDVFAIEIGAIKRLDNITLVTVTQENINAGKPRCELGCMVALAIKKYVQPWVCVDVSYQKVSFFGRPVKTRIKLPALPRKSIERFDDFEPLKPFNFLLEIPESLKRVGESSSGGANQ